MEEQRSLKLLPHRQKMLDKIAEHKARLRTIEEQIRQLEYLESDLYNTIIMEGKLVRERNGWTNNPNFYEIQLVTRVRSEERWASIYPSAHSQGRLFGLNIYGEAASNGGRSYLTNEANLGWGHSKEEAIAGARAWVLRGEAIPAKYK